MRRTWAMAVLVCSATVVAGEGSAMQPARGLYAGVDAGGSRVVVSNDNTGYYWVSDVDRISGNDAGYRLRIGYQFSRFIALEAGYTDFGRLDAKDIPYSCYPSTDCTFELRARIRTGMLGAVATLPLRERWSLHARLGTVYGRIASVARDPLAGTQHHDSSDHDGIGFGAGLDVRLGKRTTLSLDWSRHELLDLGPSFGGGLGADEYGSPSLTSLGISYRF